MTLPELDEFRRQVEALRSHPALAGQIDGDSLSLSAMALADVADLLADPAGYYLLMAAAGLNRTSLKRAVAEPETQIVRPSQRPAHAVRSRLPVTALFTAVAATAVSLRHGDLQRKARGTVEQVFRDRLADENIPILMSPPVRSVPGMVIGRRKPDGVWPDPAGGRPPEIYLEIKNVRRVRDDIQKRLYELVEASLEMKLLYGSMTLQGLAITDPARVRDPETISALRRQTAGRRPVVVGLFICDRAEAEAYRVGAEAFVDRIFFQDEIEDCIDYLRRSVERLSMA